MMRRALKPGTWVARQVLAGQWVVLWPDTSRPGTHWRRIDAAGHFDQRHAEAIAKLPDLVRLAELVANTDPADPIGLATLVELARRALPQET